jgi:hypothetical protein
VLQQLGHRTYEAESWQSLLSSAEQQYGDHRAAVDCYQRALGLFRELGDRCSQATVLTHLGDAQHAAEQTAAARTARHEAVTILNVVTAHAA